MTKGTHPEVFGRNLLTRYGKTRALQALETLKDNDPGRKAYYNQTAQHINRLAGR